MRGKSSLKPLKVAGATVFDLHVSPSAHVEYCCSSLKQIKKMAMVLERLERILDELMRKSGFQALGIGIYEVILNKLDDAICVVHRCT